MQLYEDLIAINRSPKLIDAAIQRRDRVLNVQNTRRGVSARRGDGTFGEIIPGENALADAGYLVYRGPVATVEIGVEVKILAKAMIKQIDRVINDLRNQVVQFKRGGGNPITVGIVGINQAQSVIGYEGDRPFPTTGRAGFLHPFQEAPEAERRLRAEAQPELMNSWCCVSKRPTLRPILSSGPTTTRRGLTMPLHSLESALGISSDSRRRRGTRTRR